MKLSKKYNFSECEKKWQDYWEKNNIFSFDWNDTDRNNIYSIDTPPPTVSGTLHMGHIYSYTQTDFIARFQRMYGKNVFYPIGFDDNGLPTERYVEKLKGIKGKNLPREEFVKICQETAPIEELKFQELFKSISHSYDWSLKYQTISDKSKKISQMSFIELYNKGVLYRKDEPCIWDIIDQTALAQTEVEDKEFESQMNYIYFSTLNGEKLKIMTTRPELLPACVALIIHPDFYEKYKNTKAITPLGVEVPIISDDKVDREKGTGFVMCCTFGDQTDIEWWKKYNLETRIILNEKGIINLNNIKNIINKDYLELEGLKIEEARIKILEILKKNNQIFKDPEKITHSVKIGERSKHPIEFLVKKQWNIKVLNIKEELHKKASECKWHPDWMESRIHNWIDGLSWDWTISRQRFSGVPIPVWYSKRKGEEGKIILPNIEDLPVDPIFSLPNGYNKDEVEPDIDVLDTWATSSLSPQLSSWGISNDLCIDKKRYETLKIPFDLRPQAHEIIRTWAFCTIVKAYYHSNTIPWKNLTISGWCLASDKTKMSKSLGNIVDPVNLIKNKGSDAVRYWAGGSALGLDTAYSENNILIGQKLITKLFNSAKFVEMSLENLKDKITNINDDIKNKNIFETIDIWLISKFKNVVKKSTEYFLKYEYSKSLEETEKFFWNDFCDNYLEIVKARVYGLNYYTYKGIDINSFSKEEQENIIKKQQSSIRTIFYIFNGLLKLFSPFTPCICEEIYSCIYEEEFNKKKSISSKGNWPTETDFYENENIINIGEEVIKIVSTIRKYKSEKNISIKEELKNIKIHTQYYNELQNITDIKNVCNIENIEYINSKDFDIEF